MSCTCEVTDSARHASECISHEFNNIYDTENEQDDNADRGHFEFGYWCLKDSDCESKKCGQVGPRKYDKEC